MFIFTNRAMQALQGLAAGATLLLAGQASVQAQQYPSKPIRMLVGQASGGGTDLVARVIGDKLRDNLKQPVIVDNRPGAAGMIASKAGAEAAPDGYTLLVAGMSSTVSPSLYKAVPYDAVNGVQAIAPLMSFPFVIVVNNKMPASNLKEFIDFVRKNAAGLNVATGGATTTVTAELFSQMMGATKFTFIPFNGSAPAVVSVISGDSHAMFSDLPSAAGQIKSGAVRAIATSGDRRFTLAQDIPTARESGMPDFVVSSWYGLFGPAKMPMDIVNLLNTQMRGIVNQPDVAQKFAGMGGEPWVDSVEGFSRTYQNDLGRWKKVIVQGKIPLL
jgi:tripartite-type tricarboxylate transporter receptor subunit TctC